MIAYSVGSHLEMVADRIRTDAHREALRAAVNPGCTVLDIGTGSGVFAVFAARLGARRVYAIEPEPIIDVARQVAAANGVADRIEFIGGTSTDLTLAERASVIVSDIGGVLPMFTLALPSRIDARERLLAEGGVMIPAREPLWVALAGVDSPHRYDGDALEDGGLDIDLSAARPFATCELRKLRLSPDQLLSEPRQWAALDYRTIASADVRGEADSEVVREGTANGLVAWFDKELIEGVGFSNAPGEPETLYGQLFFPLREELSVVPGDRAQLSLEAILTGADYAWRWCTRIEDCDGREKASFDQSSVQAVPLSLDRLRRREAAYQPTLVEEGEVDRFILERMDGETPLAEIARLVRDRFPRRYGSGDGTGAALRRVAALSERYGS